MSESDGPDHTDPTGGSAYDPFYVPATPAKSQKRPLILVGVGGLVVGGLIAGIVTALATGGTNSSGKPQPATLSLSTPLPFATGTDSAPFTAPTNCDGFPTPSGIPAGTIATPGDGTCVLILPRSTITPTTKPGATVTATASASGTATATATAKTTASVKASAKTSTLLAAGTPTPSTAAASACGASDFQLALSTDQTSYLQTKNVVVTATVQALRACTTPGPPSGKIYESSPTGSVLEEFADCGTHDGAEPSCEATGPMTWRAGETETYTDTWSQAVKAGDGAKVPATYAVADTYVATLAVGAAQANTSFAITQAPACAASALATSFITTDKSTAYVQGQTAHFAAAIGNNGSTACTVDLAGGSLANQATDSSGNVVWDSGNPNGATYPFTASGIASGKADPVPVPAGQVVPRLDASGNETTAAYAFTWALAADGTKASPSPSAVADGSYAMTWGGYDGLAQQTKSVALTVSG